MVGERNLRGMGVRISFVLTIIAMFVLWSVGSITTYAAPGGSCGDGVIWSYNEGTKTLTISSSGLGTGVMDGYFYNKNRPWGKYVDTLTNIVIEDGVTVIGHAAFYQCGNLTELKIPSSVTEIEWSAFDECKSLQSVIIPSSVTALGNGVFFECESLQSVILPSTITQIGQNMFNGCRSLQSVTLPEGMTEIGDDFFYQCSSLESVIIPSGVTRIGDYAFDECSNLKSLTIPANVNQIGYKAFYNCKNLESVTMESTTPPTLGEKAFLIMINWEDKILENVKIYAPLNCGDIYREANGWQKYKDHIFADFTIHSVTFNASGHGEVPETTIDVKYNTMIEPPTIEEVDEYGVEDWYKEPECINPWNFKEDTVKEDITLYAKWHINKYAILSEDLEKINMNEDSTITVNNIKLTTGSGCDIMSIDDGAVFFGDDYTLSLTNGKAITEIKIKTDLSGNASDIVDFSGPGWSASDDEGMAIWHGNAESVNFSAMGNHISEIRIRIGK